MSFIARHSSIEKCLQS